VPGIGDGVSFVEMMSRRVRELSAEVVEPKKEFEGLQRWTP
jgi:hypothetical protein